MNLKAIIIPVGGFMLILFGTLVFSCIKKPVTVNPGVVKKYENLRFQRVETFVFQRTDRGTTTAVIYEDTKTGIHYLYIWKGGIYGGPCITRLWEK